MEEIIMRLILKEDYKKFITNIVKYSGKYEECMVDDIEEILKAMSIAIILIGFTKKPVNIDEYNIKLKDNKNIKINTKDFCNEFKEYIQKVEDLKFNMLKDIT